MQVKENLKGALIFLDKEEDFSKKSLNEVFEKILNYKKLPFHDVVLNMDSKHYSKFWEPFITKKLDYKNFEIKNDKLTVLF
jgi:hypothetical protein